MISENEKSRGVGSADGCYKLHFRENNTSEKKESQAFSKIRGSSCVTQDGLVNIILNLSIKETLLYLLILRKTKGYSKISRVITSKEIKEITGLNEKEIISVRESLKRKRIINYNLLPFNDEKSHVVYQISEGEAICHN